jgi:hypothetical protein
MNIPAGVSVQNKEKNLAEMRGFFCEKACGLL